MTERLIQALARGQKLSREEFLLLLTHRGPKTDALVKELATQKRRQVYGDGVFLRGLVEIGNLCQNDCYYCGIRHSNPCVKRYRLSEKQILACADQARELGLGTVVLQGGEGEGLYPDDFLCPTVAAIKEKHPQMAVTLSLGERSEKSYRRLKAAGADRYLLRHETADPIHYAALHPAQMSLAHRLECLHTLKALGFQTGCGMMVGSPFQTPEHLAADLELIENFAPQMCGVGPFIPQTDTPFGAYPAGSVDTVCFLLGLIRLMHPAVLLPATTAMASLDPLGREKALAWGANVIMPNLSPPVARENYLLYNNKLSAGTEAAEGLQQLKTQLLAVGRFLAPGRGDYTPEEKQ